MPWAQELRKKNIKEMLGLRLYVYTDVITLSDQEASAEDRMPEK